MAVTTPAATSKPTTLKAQSSVVGEATTSPPKDTLKAQSCAEPFSLTDALATLSYLSGRGLLCSTCGYGWAIMDNAAYSHCSDCKRPNMTYNPKLGKGSDFERLLCKRLRDWVGAFLQADQATSADTADSKGK